MDINCNYSNKRYYNKPTAEEIPNIQKELCKPTKINVEELARGIINGANFRAAAINGMKDNNFISQQLIALDFDNATNKVEFETERKITPQQAIELSFKNDLKPFLVYETYSSTKELVKFRMLFLLDAAITDIETRNKIQEYFIYIFGKYIDTSCKNAARIFFGSNAKKYIYKNSENINSVKDILRRYNAADNKIYNEQIKGAKIKKYEATSNNSITAIINHDYLYFKNKFGKERKEFETKEEFYNYIYKEISLADFLEIEPNKPICCIIPSHKDKSPSANIFKANNGTWLYKCFSHNGQKTYNIRQLIEIIGNFKTVYQSTEFIKKALNIEIVLSEWQIEQQNELNYIINTIDIGEFKSCCPTAAKVTKYCLDIFRTMIAIAQNNIYSEEYTTPSGEIIFFATQKRIIEAAGRTPNSKQKDKVNKYIATLTYCDMIRKLSNEEIPPKLLKKAYKITNNKRHVQFYCIPAWVITQIEQIEQYGEQWLNNGYRTNGISFEMFYRTEGYNTAKRIYPQHATAKGEERKTTAAADKKHELITEIILKQIQERGYATEYETLNEIRKIYKSKNFTDKQLKRSLPDILNANNLEKVRCNKDLKSKFNINCNGYPNIIITI